MANYFVSLFQRLDLLHWCRVVLSSRWRKRSRIPLAGRVFTADGAHLEVGVPLVGWLYRAAGVLGLLLAVGTAVAGGAAFLAAAVLLGVLGVLCFALGSGMLRLKPWALAACPAALRPRSARATAPRALATPRPPLGTRIVAGLLRAIAFLGRAIAFFFAFLMTGVPMGVFEGDYTPRAAYGLLALFGVLSLSFFVGATRLLRAGR